MESYIGAVSTVVIATSCLAGCMAKGPVFTEAAPPSKDRALIYIYRRPTIVVSAQSAGFDANDRRIGILDSGGYTFFYAPPGRYEIKQFWPINLITVTNPGMWTSLKIPVEVNAGETHYIRMDSYTTTVLGGPGIGWQINEVPASIARQEIAQEKFALQDKSMPAEFKP